MRIDASGLHYRDLNARIRDAVAAGQRELILDHVNGQRYLSAGLNLGLRLTINGTPGNDLAAFMDGAEIIVNGNAQDGVGNAMNRGLVVVRGNAGDILGYSMRSGRIFVQGSVGYRVGIHMKSFGDQFPLIIVGGLARDFLGEYMAGGVLVLLGLTKPKDESLAGNRIGTGMHGGVIYIRGSVEDYQLGKEVGRSPLTDADWQDLSLWLAEYSHVVDVDTSTLRPSDFLKLTPHSRRPYGALYAY